MIAGAAGGGRARLFVACIDGRELRMEVASFGGGRFSVTLDEQTRQIERGGEGDMLLLSIDGEVCEAVVARDQGGPPGHGGASASGEGATYSVTVKGRPYSVRLLDPLKRGGASGLRVQEGPVDVRAIMPGRIAALLVTEGQEVRSGQGVVVVEAMKMENELPAPKDGRVTRIRVRPGETVEAGAALFTVE